MRTARFTYGIAVGLAGLAAIWSATASAHAPERVVQREMVRLQGYKAPPAGVKIARELLVVVFGTEVRLHLTDWQRFGLDNTAPAAPPEPPRLTLQGDRDVLDAFASARPDQRITILAERRAGAGDLFILALDLCPPR